MILAIHPQHSIFFLGNRALFSFFLSPKVLPRGVLPHRVPPAAGGGPAPEGPHLPRGDRGQVRRQAQGILCRGRGHGRVGKQSLKKCPVFVLIWNKFQEMLPLHESLFFTGPPIP